MIANARNIVCTALSMRLRLAHYYVLIHTFISKVEFGKSNFLYIAKILDLPHGGSWAVQVRTGRSVCAHPQLRVITAVQSGTTAALIGRRLTKPGRAAEYRRVPTGGPP